jgi:acyl dehydratase
MGKYFEDFEVGEESETAGRTVTETDIVNFAAIGTRFTQTGN